MHLYSPKLFIRDRWVLGSLCAMVVSLAVAWWYTVSHISPTSDQLLLHYTIIFGIDLVGEWWKLYMVPLAGAVVLLVNTLISFLVYGADVVFARLIMVVSVVVHIFMLIGLLKMIGLSI